MTGGCTAFGLKVILIFIKKKKKIRHMQIHYSREQVYKCINNKKYLYKNIFTYTDNKFLRHGVKYACICVYYFFFQIFYIFKPKGKTK